MSQTFSAPEAYDIAAAVSPNDSVDLPRGQCKGLYIGATGNVEVNMADGQTVLFSAVPVGLLPVSVTRVLAGSTTATNIVALY